MTEKALGEKRPIEGGDAENQTTIKVGQLVCVCLQRHQKGIKSGGTSPFVFVCECALKSWSPSSVWLLIQVSALRI